MMFSRPTKGEQTRHLFIGNCGPAVGLSEDQCLSLLPESGHPELVIPSQQASHIFVSFEDVGAAVAAMKHLQRAPGTANFGRSLVVRHAAIKVSHACRLTFAFDALPLQVNAGMCNDS